MRVYQFADKEHQSSIWFDGLVAETKDYALIANGEICIYYIKDGEYIGMYDGKARDSFPHISEDADLDNENFEWDMNNWFEVFHKDGSYGYNEVAHTYDEAIELLQQMQEDKNASSKVNN